MFKVEMEYWFTGYEGNIDQRDATTLEEAEKIASDFASEAEKRLNEADVAWGYDFPGISFNGLGRRYSISGGGENYDIYIRLE